MQTYRQYCPVAKAHEILGDRWTMLIVRELLGGQDTFNGIARGLPGIPRSVLSNRLNRLVMTGVLDKEPKAVHGAHYRLTAAGRALRPVVEALGQWGASWAFDVPNEEDLDPGLLLWRMQNRLNADHLPAERVCIEFRFRTRKRNRFWFVIDDGAASVCLTDPGFDIGLVVDADLSAFYQVWLGRMPLKQAVAQDLIRIDGMPALERDFPTWFQWSPMARFVTAARNTRSRA